MSVEDLDTMVVLEGDLVRGLFLFNCKKISGIVVNTLVMCQ